MDVRVSVSGHFRNFSWKDLADDGCVFPQQNVILGHTLPTAIMNWMLATNFDRYGYLCCCKQIDIPRETCTLRQKNTWVWLKPNISMTDTNKQQQQKQTNKNKAKKDWNKQNNSDKQNTLSSTLLQDYWTSWYQQQKSENIQSKLSPTFSQDTFHNTE